eukprot:scaffold159879_cov20-Prasinocladus_malaysianus.AAC.1
MSPKKMSDQVLICARQYSPASQQTINGPNYSSMAHWQPLRKDALNHMFWYQSARPAKFLSSHLLDDTQFTAGIKCPQVSTLPVRLHRTCVMLLFRPSVLPTLGCCGS